MAEAVNPLAKGSHLPYLVAVVVMILIGVVAVMALVLLRPNSDNTQLIATIVSMIVPTTAAILALMKSQETHVTVNSQLAQWKLDFADLQRAQGEKQGREGEQARVADMKKTAAAERGAGPAPLVVPVVTPAVVEVGTVQAKKPDMVIKADEMILEAGVAKITKK